MLITFEGQSKRSKIKSAMKRCSKCISMVTAKTASRNITFKVTKMGDSVIAVKSAV